MAVFEKDALYPGTYHLPDGRKVTYSLADVRHLGQRAKAMISAGLQIPVAWEHQDDAVPQSEAERRANRARFNLGHATDAGVSPEGYLTARVEVPVADDAKRLPAVGFVSPEIRRDWIDGSGKLWPGLSITHLAVTPRPVQHKQKPFKPVKMSLDVVRLSLADVRLGDNPVDEEKDDDDKQEKKGDDDSGDNESEEAKTETVVDSSGMMKRVIGCLAEMGMMLGEGVTAENLLERLYVAAETKKAVENPGSTNMNANNQPAEATEAAGGGGYSGAIAMSLEKRVQASEKRLVGMERNALKQRIRGLLETGRVNPRIAKKLREDLDKVQLAINDDGELRPNPVLSRVEAYEALDPSTAWSSNNRLSQASEADGDPADSEAKEAEKIGDEWAADIRARRGRK